MHDKDEKKLGKDIFLQHSTSQAELSRLLSISAHSAFRSIVKDWQPLLLLSNSALAEAENIMFQFKVSNAFFKSTRVTKKQ